MADDAAEILTNQLADLALEGDSNKISADAKSHLSGETPSSSTPRKIIYHRDRNWHSQTPSSSAKQTVDNCIAGHGTSRSRRIPRKPADSPTENGNAVSTTEAPKPDLALSQFDILTLQNEKNKFMEVVSMFWSRFERQFEKTNELSEKLNRAQEELKSCKEQLETSKRQNQNLEDAIKEQMRLDGRSSIREDEIRFERKRFDGEFSEIICSRIFRFPKWENSAIHGPNSEDRSAIAFVKLFGRLYGAKAGMNRGDFADFIDSDHWTKEAVLLSRKIGMPPDRGYATHAEIQLITFYITRVMEACGFGMLDIDNTKVYDACRSFGGLVVIHVSQKVCPTCDSFVKKVNEITSNYDLKFKAEDKSVETQRVRTSPPSEGIPQKFADEIDSHSTS